LKNIDTLEEYRKNGHTDHSLGKRSVPDKIRLKKLEKTYWLQNCGRLNGTEKENLLLGHGMDCKFFLF
jgi:hypothetical protein